MLDSHAEVVQAELAWAEALRALDLDAMTQLLADEYAHIMPDGRVEGKTETLASFVGEQRHWDFAEATPHTVQVYGDTAVVIGRWTARGVNHGVAFDYSARYLGVWVKCAGCWQLVADQSTEIRDSS